MSNVVLSSLWRDDAEKNLEERALHLLNKTHDGRLRWVWTVGDSTDDTAEELARIAREHPEQDIEVIRHNTCIMGERPNVRLRRMSQTVNAAFDRVRDDDDYWIIHESDLQSPPDLAGRFLATGRCPVAGWPMLEDLFYDTWAYRKDGVHFSNNPPYHACYRVNEVFEVDSAGSCWMLDAEDLQAGVRCDSLGAVELCRKLKAKGRRIWVDPSIAIVQPWELWVCQGFADG